MKTTSENLKIRRERHHAALLHLYRGTMPRPTGLQLWQRLRRVECKAANAATAQCNGKAYQGQPYREEKQWDEFCDKVRIEVGRILGAVPDGFFFNTDPRGFALKINPDKAQVPSGLETDWGRNGCLAATIDN